MTSHHLTEAERHAAAEGALAADRRRALEAHLATCASCADDVRRIASTVDAIRGAPPPASPTDMWPAIRARIDAAKILPLPAAVPTRRRRIVTRWSMLGLVAAAIVVLVVPVVRGRGRDVATTEGPRTDMVPVADSLDTYRAEALLLLNQFELQRAVMRPEAAATIDRDLKTIDAAIGELQVAIASDPRNPALRQLLAASYRQKADLLRRAQNAS